MHAAPAQTVLTLRLPARPESVGTARRQLRRMLGAERDQDLVETATLLLSELVTNAVAAIQRTTPRGEQAAPTPGVTVVVSRDEECLRIAVTDPAPSLTAAREAGLWAEGGRGLAMVNAMASTCGEEKTVWCELRTHQTVHPTSVPASFSEAQPERLR